MGFEGVNTKEFIGQAARQSQQREITCNGSEGCNETTDMGKLQFRGSLLWLTPLLLGLLSFSRFSLS